MPLSKIKFVNLIASGEIMKNNSKTFCLLVFFCGLNLFNTAFSEEIARPDCKCPDYVFEYLGNDKFENYNRKMFNFNSKLNKYAIKPIHILWASIMPKYGMDRIKGIATNIEYPARLVSSLIQKDFETSKNETIRFFTNTTIGLGGMYDPAKRFLKIQPSNENMEQAFAKCHVKPGPYLVCPVINGTSPRNLAGKLFDAALNPSCYIATPVLAAVKAGLLVNRTSYMQPIMKMIESNYADPYDITRKLYGVENYMKCHNYDRKEVLDTAIDFIENDTELDGDNLLYELEPELVKDNSETELGTKKLTEAEIDEKHVADKVEADSGEKLSVTEIINAGDSAEGAILKAYNTKNSKLMADMLLFDYKPQNPVTDSMRTALFDLPDVDESIWAEISLWNRCFSNRIKTSSVNLYPERENYKYRYILQKGMKTSPLAIIFPSIGEGITSSHSVLLAKMFYDEGYSVIILGSAFQWEFAKSMPEDYRPGIPSQDADYLKTLTHKVIASVQNKHKYEFNQRVVLGTSFGALTALFLADKEYKNNTLNITKYISICPPVELIYAMEQVDKTTAEWEKNPDNLKDRVAITAAKILQISQMEEKDREKIQGLPFSEYEAKLITGFIMHQKLSDLVYTIENENISDKKELYCQINNMTYQDYAQKYLLDTEYETVDDLKYVASLHSISDYLKNNDNYKIYHSINDYLTTPEQLKKLKTYTGAKSTYLDNGSHLGFLYRKEFQQELKKEISMQNPASKTTENDNSGEFLASEVQKSVPAEAAASQEPVGSDNK